MKQHKATEQTEAHRIAIRSLQDEMEKLETGETLHKEEVEDLKAQVKLDSKSLKNKDSAIRKLEDK